MPDDYYVSQYSGEEIDERLTAAHNAVRYDAAQSLTDAQKTQARGNIAAAPSGGGVMEMSIEISAASASESYDTLCAKLDAVLATMPSSSVKFLSVYPPQYYGLGEDMCALFKNINDYASVYTIGSYNTNRQGFRMIKRKRYSSDPAGKWEPLEYINPEMNLGVEYRTTERYLGKPVYCKVVDCGNLPAPGSLKNVSHGVSGCLPIMVTGQMSNTNTIPWKGKYTVSADNINIVLYSQADESDFSNLTATAILKYTKTTD